MARFQIDLVNGETETAVASIYDVNDHGDLNLTLEGSPARTFNSGTWVTIRQVGTPLAKTWPDPALEGALQNLRNLLAVRWGYYVHELGSADDYASEIFNDLDTLAEAVLNAVGIDPVSTSDKDVIQETRTTIAQQFRISLAN